MADQVNGTLFEDGPADFLHMPHLKAMAERSVRFRNAYTPSYLCAPSARGQWSLALVKDSQRRHFRHRNP